MQPTVQVAAPPAVEAVAIQKALPFAGGSVAILRGISLCVQPGEFVALAGPSGSGKSTLLGILAGLDRPTEGQVWIAGRDITRVSESRLAAVRNAQIGMVFQAFNLIPTLTACENVAVPLLVGAHAGDPTARARAMLDLVGLGRRGDHRPAQLSGGEQQRVAIARALVTHPALVFMDEPTGNLDQANGAALLQLLAALRRQPGPTFVIATHDPAVAGAADRTIHLVDGRVADERGGDA